MFHCFYQITKPKASLLNERIFGIFTPTNKVAGKVMFQSCLSVGHSVHGSPM